jgi:hypothetical protein
MLQLTLTKGKAISILRGSYGPEPGEVGGFAGFGLEF